MTRDIKYSAPGDLVSVNGHMMHVFLSGKGTETFVFMAGSGTPCPVLDFKPLWSILANHYRIAVIEKAGYGWSEVTNCPRDIDTMLYESRKALKSAGADAPYILVPHSMSGLEALYWAQKFPEEVRAIVGLDAAIPESYCDFKLPPFFILKLLGFLTKLGIHKPFAKSYFKKCPVAQSGVLTQDEKKVFIEVIKKRTLTRDMINEGRYLLQNKEQVKNSAIPIHTPTCFFISSQTDKGIANWSKILTDYTKKIEKGKAVLLDCGHYIHAYESARIAEEIGEFIKGTLEH